MESRFFLWTHKCTGDLEHDFWESYAFSTDDEGHQSWSNANADKENVVDLTDYFPPDQRNRQRVFEFDEVDEDSPAWMVEVRNQLHKKWAPAGALRVDAAGVKPSRWIFFGWDNT